MNFLEAIKSLKKTKKDEIKQSMKTLSAQPLQRPAGTAPAMHGASEQSAIPSTAPIPQPISDLKDILGELPELPGPEFSQQDKGIIADIPPLPDLLGNLPELPKLEPLDLPPLPPKKDIIKTPAIAQMPIAKIEPAPKTLFPMQEIPEEIEISTKQYSQQLFPPKLFPPKPVILEPTAQWSKASQPTTMQPTIQEKPRPLQPTIQPQPSTEKPTKPLIRPEQLGIEKSFVMERSIDATKPVFVRVTHYSDIFSHINEIKKTAISTDEHSMNIHDITIKKNKLLYKWQDQLEDIQRMLISMDKSLFEQEE